MEEERIPGGAMKRIFLSMKRVATSEYLSLVLSIYVGLFFVFAAIAKIPDPTGFAESVAAYRLIPYSFLNLGAVILPWLELVCGLCLIFGVMERSAATIVGALLVMFIVMIKINVLRGVQINCGCFGTGGEIIGWKKVIEDTVLLLFTIQIFFFYRMVPLQRVLSWIAMRRKGSLGPLPGGQRVIF